MSGGGPVMDEGVGSQRDQRIDVIGGPHPDRVDATELTGVATDLGCAGDPDADEIEARMANNFRYDHSTHEAGSPHDDAARAARSV